MLQRLMMAGLSFAIALFLYQCHAVALHSVNPLPFFCNYLSFSHCNIVVRRAMVLWFFLFECCWFFGGYFFF